MTAVNLKKILNDANNNQYAVAGLVVLGWDDALAFTQAADETGIPIILQAGPSCRSHTPIPVLGKMFRYLADQTKTHICCHIDHGYTINECLKGIESGFTSVMFDGSKLPIEENIKLTKEIVSKAHKYNISVEGEIGFVGYANGKNSKGTDVEEAIKFAKNSNIDAMAISAGNTHLQTSKKANIDFNKIRLIQKKVKVPLVLHGSSGIPLNQRKKLARNTNVAKLNIGTEIRMVFGESLRKNLKTNKKVYDRIKILNPTIRDLVKVTKKVIKQIGPE